MKHGSLFSGVGGFDLAAEWMGWENMFHCEWNEFGQKVLKYYWPKAISYEDITKTDFSIWRGRIDILTGGFPCQPYSTAGKRRGKEDERHLWPEMLRAIREIRPSYVVGENVSGLINWNGGMVFDEVQAELEAQGYEVLPFVLPAAGVDAPHRRDRVWFIAKNTNEDGRGGNEWKEESGIGEFGDAGSGNNERISADDEEIGITSNSNGTGPSNDSGTDSGTSEEIWGKDAGDVSEQLSSIGIITDSYNERLQRSEIDGSIGGSGEKRDKFVAGLLRSDWKEFPTQSPICSRDDGFSEQLDGITFPRWRSESVKAFGNAIVPQVAYEIFKAIERIKCY